jgi:hypothetical protein
MAGGGMAEHPQIGALYRGYERRRLIIDLATGELADREIAQREGISLRDIRQFRADHEREIAECQQMLMGKLAEEVAGLWIANKANRLAEYQEQAEEIRTTIADLYDAGKYWSRDHRDMLRTYLDLFRQVAEELGAYPQRASAPAQTGKAVHYVIETDDVKALQ